MTAPPSPGTAWKRLRKSEGGKDEFKSISRKYSGRIYLPASSTRAMSKPPSIPSLLEMLVVKDGAQEDLSMWMSRLLL